MQTTWITGATSGLGKALAVELANRGASLVLCGRRASALEELITSLPRKEGQVYYPLVFDLGEVQDYGELVKEAIAAVGPIHYLVHNAGLSQKGYFEQTAAAVEDTLWRVNYLSTVALTRALLPEMVEWGGGQIVVVGSIAGRYGAPFLTTYSATKHALYGFYESLRYEVEGKGVKVLMVTPGFIKTDIAKKALNEQGEAAMQDSKAQANGIPPARAARKIYRAMAKKKNGTIVIAKVEIVFLWLRRLSPRLFHFVIKKLHGL